MYTSCVPWLIAAPKSESPQIPPQCAHVWRCAGVHHDDCSCAVPDARRRFHFLAVNSINLAVSSIILSHATRSMRVAIGIDIHLDMQQIILEHMQVTPPRWICSTIHADQVW